MQEHTPEWHQWRAQGIGGSDIAAIAGPLLGFKAWASPWDVYLDKTGKAPPRPENDRMRYGKMVEKAVAEAWAASKGFAFLDWGGKPWPPTNVTVPTVVWKPPMTSHAHEPVVRGSPDALVIHPDGTCWILEVKTSGVEMRYLWADEPPMKVLVQGQWYAGIWRSHNYNVTHVVTLCEINHDAPLEWRHEYRPGLFKKLVNIGVTWWDARVLANNPPPLDGSDACHGYIETAYKRARGAVLDATPEDENLFTDFFAAQDAIAAAEEKLDTIKATIKARMGAHEVLQGKAHSFTFKANKAGVYSLTVKPPRGKA